MVGKIDTPQEREPPLGFFTLFTCDVIVWFVSAIANEVPTSYVSLGNSKRCTTIIFKIRKLDFIFFAVKVLRLLLRDLLNVCMCKKKNRPEKVC